MKNKNKDAKKTNTNQKISLIRKNQIKFIRILKL
jgi:hypothetical protein